MRILHMIGPFCSKCKHWTETGSYHGMTDSYRCGRCAKGHHNWDTLLGSMRDNDGCTDDYEPREAEKAGTDD